MTRGVTLLIVRAVSKEGGAGMTAEIAILNKSAVALAADSAVTVQTGGRPGKPKIYHSATKLFTLSKYEPVGVMIYGGVELSGVPWETIIKDFRAQLGRKAFDRLEDYATALIKHLDRPHHLITRKIQADYVYLISFMGFSYIKERVVQRAQQEIGKTDGIDDPRVSALADACAREELQRLLGETGLPHLPRNHPRTVVERYRKQIDQGIKDVFEELPLSPACRSRLRRMIGNVFYRKWHPHPTGIVVAGFGREDTFPVLQSFEIDCLVADRLKYEDKGITKIDAETNAVIVPFAQRDVVETFVEGATREYIRRTEEYWTNQLRSFRETVVEALKPYLGDDLRRIQQALRKTTDGLMRTYLDTMGIWRRRAFVDPILDTVASSPKTELPAIAEALVNLTALKRRVASDEGETVGGPIDVAIISKSDGFIWIKRKHYFTQELNPYFLANYFREDKDGAESE